MNKEKTDSDVDLSDDVIDRVNVGVIAVSLSLYEEGMSLEELIEVTGIKESDVRKSLDYLMSNRMIRKKLNQESYHVSNFKKMLQFLLSSGMIFPLGEQITKTKEDK
jgi:hypothetical protein